MSIELSNRMAAIAVNKSLLKEYSSGECSRTVYLKDESEFQIQLFNPYSYTVGAQIRINGEDLGNTLVLRPGERIWLERYLNEAKKFKFSTYKVEADNEAVKRAIRNNGEVVVNFFKETKAPKTPLYWDNKNFYYDNWNYDTRIKCADLLSDVNYCSCTNTAASTIETGRIEKGSSSNQKFDNVDISFEYFPTTVEIIKILPESAKSVTSYDLDKIYCTECGRKLKSKYKFCPFCGTKID